MDKKIELAINHGQPSFIKDPSILAYLYEFFNDFEDKFPNTLVHVHLIEEVNPSSRVIKPRELGRVKDRKLRIVIAFSRFRKGSILTTPSPTEFYNQLRFVMDKEVENYVENINEMNPVLETRLKQMGIDLSTEKSPSANHLKSSLALANYPLNFNLRINELTDEDLYQLGSSIIVQANKGKIYNSPQLVSEMVEMLESR